MEELSGFLIFVIWGVIYLVKFLSKQQAKPEEGARQPSQRGYGGQLSPQQSQSNVKTLLSEALKEIQSPKQAQSKKVSQRIEKEVQKSYNVSPASRRAQSSSVTPKEVFHEEHGIARALRTKKKLRDAFIMKEILDRPVSERF